MTKQIELISNHIACIEKKLEKAEALQRTYHQQLDVFNWIKKVEHTTYIGNNRQTLLLTSETYPNPAVVAQYGTKPTLHYYKKQFSYKDEDLMGEQYMFIGRTIAASNAIATVEVIDDADFLISCNYLDSGKASYECNKDCKSYLGKIDFKHIWISKTIEFMSKLNANNPGTLPEWIDNYLFLS